MYFRFLKTNVRRIGILLPVSIFAFVSSCGVQLWKNFWNRPTFAKVMNECSVACFWLTVCDIKSHNCCQRTTYFTSHSFTCALTHRSLSTRKMATEYSLPQSSWLFRVGCRCFGTEVVLLESYRWLSEVRSVRLLGSDKSGHSKRSDRPTVTVKNADRGD